MKKKQTQKTIEKVNNIEVLNEDEDFTHMNTVKYGSKFEQFMDKKFIKDKLLVHMYLRNGDIHSFFVSSKEENFKFRGGEYIIDVESQRYNKGTKCNESTYHIDLTLPLKFTINPNDIHKHLSDLPIRTSLNPMVLHRRLKTNTAMNVMEATNTEAWIRQNKIMLMLILIVVIAILLMLCWKFGIFQQLSSSLPI